MYLLLAIVLVGLEASYEGLKYKGYHIFSATIEALYRAIIVVGLFLWITNYILSPWELKYPENFWKIIIAFILFRFGCFDLIINKIMKLKWWFVGTTKVYDKFITWICSKTRMPIMFFRYLQLLCGFIGAMILLFGNTNRI